jgi:hypothetical protein
VEESGSDNSIFSKNMFTGSNGNIWASKAEGQDIFKGFAAGYIQNQGAQ